MIMTASMVESLCMILLRHAYVFFLMIIDEWRRSAPPLPCAYSAAAGASGTGSRSPGSSNPVAHPAVSIRLLSTGQPTSAGGGAAAGGAVELLLGAAGGGKGQNTQSNKDQKPPVSAAAVAR